MLLGTQFQHFILEMAEEASPATGKVQVSSPPHDVHLEEVDLSYPEHGMRTLQAGPSQYQSPPLLERHTNTSYYYRMRKKPSQLDRVEKGLSFVYILMDLCIY